MSADEELRLIAIMRSAEGGAAVSELCENLSNTQVDVRVTPIEEFISQDDHLNGNDVLLLDIDPTNSEDDRNLRAILSEKFPSTPVLITTPDVSLDEIRTFMKIGVIDVLSQPIRQTDLVIALDHASRFRPEAPRSPRSIKQGKVITFLQGGGGVGATVLATQGGCVLATEAVKEGEKVCLLDFDIQFGTAGLYLDLNSSVGFVDLIENQDRLDASFLRGAMTKHESGLDLLICPGSVIPLDALTPEFVKKCVRLAQETYDFVLVDLSTDWTSWSYAVLCESDIVLLIAEMTVGSIRQSVRQLETLSQQDVNRPIVRVVLNKYQRGWGLFGKTFGESANVEDAQKALGRKFDHLITSDFDVMSEAINQGVQLDKIEGSARIHKEINLLMKDCRELLAPESALSDEGSEPRVATGKD